MRRIKADDYFCMGPIEIARFGNTVISRNNMTEEQHKEWIFEIANKYDKQKEKIDNLIEKIKEKLSLVDPLMLFNYLTSMNFMMHLFSEVTSENEQSSEAIYQMRSVEYIQSLLVSINHDKNSEIKGNQESIYEEIRNLCAELYENILCFFTYWSTKQQVEEKLSFEDEEYIVYAQMMSLVRGEQYQVFRIPVLKELLLPQDSLLKEIYGLSASDILSGLDILEKNLSSGRLDAMNELGNQIDKLGDFVSEEPNEEYKEASRKIISKAIGTALYEVKENTKWTDTFINDLSLGIGSDNSFLTKEEYKGWPIWNLPIQYKPFIYIDGIAYCFDYYTLFDNFYVAIQRAVRSHGMEYGKRWNEVQKLTSEGLVGNVFENLLPGCIVHYSNYYPINKSNGAENDILIEYKDTLLIVEVKAGTFVYTPAMTDYKAHKESFRALVEKAEDQCLRVRKYINDCKANYLSFYSDDKLDKEAFSLDIRKINTIYMFDVTVSDFNEFASQMEKIKIANTHEDIITLSLNDLWVYKYYFDDPLQFIHYVRQRTIATETVEVATSDELDHLGMYIAHNMYSLQAKDVGRGSQVNFMGYREELDKYLSSVHIGKNREKPAQPIPVEIKRFLDVVRDKEEHVTLFSNFILDFSYESRNAFVTSIRNLFRREKELGRELPSMSLGDASYALFVEVPGISTISDEKREEYIYANLIQSRKEECWSIVVSLDDNGDILDVRYKLFNQLDISESKREDFQSYGKLIAEHRIEQFLTTNSKKRIYPNELCPCGSGLKYKRCCGRNANKR